MKPVRVCFLIDELATAGTESQLVALLSRLDRSRVLPFLALLRGDAEESRKLEPVGCPILRLGISSLRSLKALWGSLAFVRFLWANRIDVVQSYFPDSTWFGMPAAWLAGVRHRVRTRNNSGHWVRPGHRLMGRLMNLFSTATLSNCEAARRSLLADERANPCRSHVLENGVDLERFLALEPPVGPTRVVGTVANLRPVKGLDVLVEAAIRLSAARPDLAFRVAGEGEQRPALERRIEQAGLSGRFHLHGPCSDVPAFLGEVGVAVLPSRSEGLSNALLEYMAAARPIVATNVGANAEVVRDGIDGLIVPPEDADALAGAIARLADDRALSLRMSLSARRRAEERYGRKAMVRRFEEFYVGLAHPPGPPPRSGEGGAKRVSPLRWGTAISARIAQTSRGGARDAAGAEIDDLPAPPHRSGAGGGRWRNA